MFRAVYNDLLEWKEDTQKKPLLLQGARQVGKTYIVNLFGENEYENYVYLNFEQDVKLHQFFKNNLIPKDIIENLSIYLGVKIEFTNTLLFFDEIQVLPEVLTSLKYFNEQAPEFHIISAGSLLGVSIASHTSFPVGKVNFFNMFPMSFNEYLISINENLLADKINNTLKVEPINEVIHAKILKHLKMYFFIGGMPEAVKSYSENSDIVHVRKIQNEILEAYKRDFSKYNDKHQALRVSELWNSLPYQLTKENKKFKYSDVKNKARASTFEQTIEWLKNAGLVNVVYNVSTPKLPLNGYSNLSKFKLCLFDTGLLGALLNVPSKIIVDPNAIFVEYNGAFIENYVAQELTFNRQKQLFYWTSNSDAEVDFIIQKDNEIYPIEVKSGLSRSKKSLVSYQNKYKPKLIYRVSPRNYTQADSFINIPLYAIHFFKNKIE